MPSIRLNLEVTVVQSYDFDLPNECVKYIDEGREYRIVTISGRDSDIEKIDGIDQPGDYIHIFDEKDEAFGDKYFHVEKVFEDEEGEVSERKYSVYPIDES